MERKKISFGQAIKDFFRGYLDFKGTTSRAGYWWIALFLLLISIPLGILGILSLYVSFSIGPGMSIILAGLILIFGVSLICPMFMLQARRLRDVGLTSWGILGLIALNAIVSGGQSSLMFFSLSRGAMSNSYTGSILLGNLLTLVLFVFTLLPTDQLTTSSENTVVKFFLRNKVS